jgi:hypothetical protein
MIGLNPEKPCSSESADSAGAEYKGRANSAGTTVAGTGNLTGTGSAAGSDSEARCQSSKFLLIAAP